MLGKKFYLNVFKIAGATAIAQLIGIVTVPVISRLFSPDTVGQYALITSIAGILGVFGTGRYELALMLPEERENALSILSGTLIISLVFSALIFIMMFLFKELLISFSTFKNISQYILIIPFYILLNCLQRLFTYWFNREKQFGLNAKLIVFNSVTSKLGTVGLGAAGLIATSSFVIVNLLVQFFELGIRVCTFIKKNGKSLSILSFSDIKSEMVRYKNFPLVDIWSGFLDSGSLLIVPILLSIYFSTTDVGLYSQSLSIVQLPLSLIASAFGQVFFQRLSEDIHTDNFSKVVTEAIALMMIIGIPVFTVIFFWGQEIFTFFLGSRWAMSGVYAELLAPWCFLKLCFSPLSTIFSAMQRQGITLFIAFVTLSSRILAIVIGGIYNSCYLAILLFSIAGVIANILGLIFVLYCSKAKLSDIFFTIIKYPTLIFRILQY